MTIGKLVPCLMIPTLPGDDFNIKSQFFFKMEPLYFPLIHRMSLDVDYWWVRNGAMWPNAFDGDADYPETGWENWIMMKGGLNIPQTTWVSASNVNPQLNQSIMGYFGLPYGYTTGGDRDDEIPGLIAFPVMAYLMIYDQGYRHPSLENPIAEFRLIDGDNTSRLNDMFENYYTNRDSLTETNRFNVFNAKWAKDYLTSCLPSPTLGDAVKIPLFGVDSDGNALPQKITYLDGTEFGANTSLRVDTDSEFANATDAGKVVLAASSTIRKDLTVATVLQTLKEQLIKVGQRYKDWIDFAFDENIDPLDINVPIMIGSYRGTVQISDVLTQSNATVGEDNFYTGDYTGNAGLYETGMNAINFKCRDYGILMAIMSVTPNTGYGQGINRYWRYESPLDFPMDIFSTIGDQEVLKEEVFFNNVTSDVVGGLNKETFGYIPRFAEAMYMNNIWAGNLGFNMGLSVHAGRVWGPTVRGTVFNDNIIIGNRFLDAADNGELGGTRITDIFRVSAFPNSKASQNTIYAYVLHEINAMRCLPAFSTPKLI